jgi:hypothetical membrane protein
MVLIEKRSEMKKIKYLILAITAVSLASCGIFKKDCHCPHFSNNHPAAQTTGSHYYV